MAPLCTDTRGPATDRARGGFALVVTLALLAFGLLLLLSLVTLTRVETVAAGRMRQADRARRHALFSLQIAIGRLQAAAGPDRRITARADLLADTSGNPWWTGVWSGEPDPCTWLVSGTERDPLGVAPTDEPAADPAPGNDAVWLVRGPAGAPEQGVKLVRRPLHAVDVPGLTGTRLTGHYAWWIGDEGVKAKYNLVNPYAGAAPGTAENRRQFLSAQQCGMEKLADGLAGYVAAKADSAEGAALRDRIGRVLTPTQIPYADPAVTLATLRNQFHHLTTYSFGVLADAGAGGLKFDLTRGLQAGAAVPAGPVFPGGPDWELLRSYAGLRPSTTGGVEQVTPRAQEARQQGVHPVVVLAQMGWGGDRSGGRLRLLLEPLVVLANPWDVALAPADYRLTWRQDATIELRNPPGAEEAAVAAGPPAELLGGNPIFRIVQAGFAPGEARAFALPADVAWLPGTALTLEAGYARGRAGRELTVPAQVPSTEMSVRVAGGEAGFELALQDGGLLQTITGGVTPEVAATGTAPVTGVPVRLGLRLGDDDENAPGDAGGLRWLADFNLRAPVIPALPAWGRNPLYGAIGPRDGDAGAMLGEDAVYWGPAHRAGDGGRRYVPLFHVPRGDLHSPGQLRHATLRTDAAGSGSTVGESYADPHTPDGTEDFVHRLNAALWDRYFFSTLPPDGALPDNRRLVVFRREGAPPPTAGLHGGATAAAHLLVDGAFNVNSTSVEAWQAVLASLNGQRFAVADPATGMAGAVVAGNAFPRAANAWGGADDGWCGYRQLTDAGLHTVAAALVEQIRARGPFRSLAEFVNRPLQAPTEDARLRGVLQAALDESANPPPSLTPAGALPAAADPLLPWPAASRGHRATLAPGWLSQADVLGVLGPVLAVRSDTFLIRAYGDAVDPATGTITARAWCEAVVQRVPDYVDPTDAPEAVAGLSVVNTTYGRRFRIVGFRWLTPDEV